MSNQININLADQATLETLPGIGDILAGRIIDYRRDVHVFEEKSDLMAVLGISENLVEGLNEFVTLEGGISHLDIIASNDDGAADEADVVVDLSDDDASDESEAADVESEIELSLDDEATEIVEEATSDIELVLDSDVEDDTEAVAEIELALEDDMEVVAEAEIELDVDADASESVPEPAMVLETDDSETQQSTLEATPPPITTSTYTPTYVAPPAPVATTATSSGDMDWKSILISAGIATLFSMFLVLLFFGQSISKSSQAVKELQEKQESLIEQLHTSDANFGTLSEKADNLQADIGALSTHGEEMQTNVDELQVSVSGNQETIEAVRVETEAINGEIGEVVESTGVLREFIHAVRGLNMGNIDTHVADDMASEDETEMADDDAHAEEGSDDAHEEGESDDAHAEEKSDDAHAEEESDDAHAEEGTDDAGDGSE